MNHVRNHVRASGFRWIGVLGPASLAMLACGVDACGGGSTATGSGYNAAPGSSGASSGSSSGYSSSGASSSGSSGSSGSSSSSSGDDASDDAADATVSSSSSGDDGSTGSDAPTGDSTTSETGASGDGSMDEGGSSSGADASDGSSSGGVEAGGSSSSSSGGAVDGGPDTSSGGSVDSGSSSGAVDSGDAASGCNLSGAWAVKITVHVTWPGTTLLAASPTVAAQQPTAELWALIQGTENGLSVPGTVQPCGLDLPDFGGTLLPETYGVTFANAMWDLQPTTTGTITVSNTSATATYTSTLNSTLIGIGTTPTAWPPNDAGPGTMWPPLATAQADQIDGDNDGKNGVTATPKTGTPTGGILPYADPPVTSNIFALQRSDSLYMALRSVLTLNGALTSCTAASGDATVSAMDNHIIGCHVAGDAAANFCDSTETTFLDTNSPHLTPHAATFTAVKMANAATCTNVRAAVP